MSLNIRIRRAHIGFLEKPLIEIRNLRMLSTIGLGILQKIIHRSGPRKGNEENVPFSALQEVFFSTNSTAMCIIAPHWNLNSVLRVRVRIEGF